MCIACWYLTRTTAFAAGMEIYFSSILAKVVNKNGGSIDKGCVQIFDY